MWDVILNFIDRRKMWGYLLAFVLGIVCTVLYWTYAGRDERIAYLDDKNTRLEKHLNETLNQLKERNISNGSTADFQNAISQLQKEIDTSRKTIASLEAEKKSLSKDLKNLDAEYQACKTAADKNAGELLTIKAKLQDEQNKTAQFQNRIKNLEAAKIELEEKYLAYKTSADKKISDLIHQLEIQSDNKNNDGYNEIDKRLEKALIKKGSH